ncbi:hypothetical protein GCM10025777_21610 [Membranihabitans marinus]
MGLDESAPQINISSPLEGNQIRVVEDITSIDIEFEVTDDIEIMSISVLLDGDEIATFSTFKDYRRFLGAYTYDLLTNGEHVLSVVATDIEGKVSTEEVNFQKVSPYVPLYSGEILYMPFNGDFLDLITLQSANKVGNPGFGGESVIDSENENSYSGALNSYLTLPADHFTKTNEFSAVFWMKINPEPNRAAMLVLGPEDTANPSAANDRTKGFRFFREAAGDKQRFKLNIGNGGGENWFDGGAAADVDPSTDEWVHFAISIGADNAKVFINGQVVKEGDFGGIDWTGCNVLSIMSGAPNFIGWSHLSDHSLMDELRIFDRAIGNDEVASIIARESGQFVSTYTPKFDGEIFYLPFEGDYQEQISGVRGMPVGSPSYEMNGKYGQAYKGAMDSYVTFPTSRINHDEVSYSFWYKIQGDEDKEGIVTISPPDPDAEKPNKRTSGLRLFREANDENYIFKLNIGTGAGEAWFVNDGLNIAKESIKDKWLHITMTIGEGKAKVYFDGELVKEGDLSGIDWTDCDRMSLMSGQPRFVEWGLFSTESQMDEFRVFDKVLSAEEVKLVMAAN